MLKFQTMSPMTTYEQSQTLSNNRTVGKYEKNTIQDCCPLNLPLLVN